MGIFEDQAASRWAVKDFKCLLNVVTITEEFSNALARHKRLFKDVERLDDLGAMSRQWTLLIEFYNGSEENHDSDYPDDVDAFLGSRSKHFVGTLTLPTVGPVPARFWSYKRIETNVERDQCQVQAVFLEDSPDSNNQSPFRPPAARSVAGQFYAEYMAEMDSIGIDGDPFGEIQDFCDDLVYLASRPEAFAASIESQVLQTAKAFKRVEDAFIHRTVDAAQDVRALLTDPFASRAGRFLRKLADATTGSVSSQMSPSLVKRRWPMQMTIFDVARAVGQSEDDLIPINSSLNVLAIPANTDVYVYSIAPEARRAG